MSLIPLLTLAFATTTGNTVHAPHDSTYAIASAQLADGTVVTAIVHSEQQILVTRDDGYSWQVIRGDGIQLVNATSISYHPGLTAAGGRGAFIIGTESGAWMLEPHIHDAVGINGGLISHDKSFLSVDSPNSGTDGPTVGVTKGGSVYLLDSTSLNWSRVYMSTGSPDSATKVAIAPHAKTTSSVFGDQDVILVANGQLHISHDLGASWAISAQFSTLAQGLYDWHITAVEFSDDYLNDQTIMIGRGRLQTSAIADEGEIWMSSNGAATFSLSTTLNTSVNSLLSTPADSSGNRYWFAAGRQYPNYRTYFGTGILRSDNSGLSWSDNGSFQDFLLEDNPGKKSGAVQMVYFAQLQVAADFALSGKVFYGRQEGLFASQDSGVHWIQKSTRFANRFRDVETSVDSNGDDIVFGAGYGTGTVMHNSASSETSIVPMRTPMIYQRRVSASPNYHIDGRLLVAGNVYLHEWQSPDVTPSNPDLNTLWYEPRVRNIAANGSDAGYPRGVEHSPNFDPTGTVANADQTFFWFSAEGQMRRSSDNGATSERLFNTTTGAKTELIQCITVAPTYDATGTRTDVYSGTRNGVLYRLMDDKWLEIHNLNREITKLLVAPNYSRPNNPTLFALMAKSPFVCKITDTLTGPVNIEPLRANLNAIAPSGIALHPDFANTPIIYISTKANGALFLDLSSPLPSWSRFGNNIPAAAVADIALSKNFANDGVAYLATDTDIMKLDANNDWQDLNGVYRLDDTDDSLTTYSPNNPNVIHPSHAWPWRSTFRWSLPLNLHGTGDEVLFADYDGDYFTCPVRGSKASLMTFQGPNQGEVFLKLIEPNTGNVVASQTYDLNQTLANASELIIGVDIPNPTKVYTFKVTAILEIGEKVVIDGVEVELD
ncbi:MAG: hypothetical protein H8E25_16860 [Planctomycetes bacterium]|nr:hypothetical protein [Planctomycetota bacterium]